MNKKTIEEMISPLLLSINFLLSINCYQSRWNDVIVPEMEKTNMGKEYEFTSMVEKLEAVG